MLHGFKDFFEFEADIDSIKQHNKKPEDYLQAMQRELGIHFADLPERITTGPIKMGCRMYNTAVWRILKPVKDNDCHVRIQLDPDNSPNLNSNTYLVKNGEKILFNGKPDDKVYVIPRRTIIDILQKPFLATVQSNLSGGGMPAQI